MEKGGGAVGAGVGAPDRGEEGQERGGGVVEVVGGERKGGDIMARGPVGQMKGKGVFEEGIETGEFCVAHDEIGILGAVDGVFITERGIDAAEDDPRTGIGSADKVHGLQGAGIPVGHDGGDEDQVWRVDGLELSEKGLGRDPVPAVLPGDAAEDGGFVHPRPEEGCPSVRLPLGLDHGEAVDKADTEAVMPEDGARVEKAEWTGPEAVGREVIDIRVDEKGAERFHVKHSCPVRCRLTPTPRHACNPALAFGRRA